MTEHDEMALRLRILADLLAQGRVIHLLSSLCFVVVLAALFAGTALGAPVMILMVLALSLLTGLIETYLAVRVGFDARLFRRLADISGTLAEFDGAMVSLGLMPVGKTGRSAKARIAGARRLFAFQAFAIAGQIALAVAAVVMARLLA